MMLLGYVLFEGPMLPLSDRTRALDPRSNGGHGERHTPAPVRRHGGGPQADLPLWRVTVPLALLVLQVQYLT